MRVFVSEYICGGAWPEKTLDSSLAVEGRAMLAALVQDLLRIPDVNVAITWDTRLSEFPVEQCSRLAIAQVTSPTGEAREFKRLCDSCDVAFVIAPEFHDILASRIEMASSETLVAGCDVKATRLCSDKLQLAGFLEDERIPTIPTARFDFPHTEAAGHKVRLSFPWVIKPRDGAGSMRVYKVGTSDELHTLSRQIHIDGEDFSYVRQPFVEGLAVSCAAIVAAGQGRELRTPQIEVLPPCQQILSGDGRFSYEGADFPGQLASTDVDRIQSLVRRCCAGIPGLSGYVGFDLLVPKVEGATPIVVEINPRLTTGYLLWRKMCSDNLAVRILESCVGSQRFAVEPLSWDSDPCSIRTDSLLN